MAHGGGRRCTVCDHPERSTIDKQLANNSTSKRIIATKYGLSLSAVFRHSKSCVLPLPIAVARNERIKTMIAEQTEAAVEAHKGHTDAFLERVDYLNNKLGQLLDEAEADAKGGKDLRVRVLREIRETLKLQANVTFQILDLKDQDDSGNKGEFIALISAALVPYPDALQAVERAVGMAI